jgi:ribose-phosphate pyrophosphokinase
MSHHYQIVAANATKDLAESISQKTNIPLQLLESSRFPNQELKIRLKPGNSTTILLGSFSSPVNTNIIEYMLAADALKRQGCNNIMGIISYLAYSKQDKVFLPGEPLSAKVIASIIQTGPFTRLYTMDLHNPSISGYFDIPVINLSAVETLAEDAASNVLPDSIVVSPDAGSIKNSNRFAQKLNVPLAFATKHRDLETGAVTFDDLSRPVQDQNVYIYDDMIATGSTLVELAEFLSQKGAASIHIYCTHHLYVNGVQDKIAHSSINSLTVTNTIAKPEHVSTNKLRIIDIAPIIANQLTTEVHYD